jgi:putative salt-induced outer membrane protein YdiY
LDPDRAGRTPASLLIGGRKEGRNQKLEGKSGRRIVSVFLTACFGAGGLAATEPGTKGQGHETGWSDKAEFSYVLTSGNSQTTTFSLKNVTRRVRERQSFQLRLEGLRVRSEESERWAVGSGQDDFVLYDESETQTKAEKYVVSGRYDHRVTKRFFWFGGAGWDRNRIAGIENRYDAFGGVGHIVIDSAKTKFRTDYSVTYTEQQDVIPDPDKQDSFAGLRLSWDFLRDFDGSASYGNETVIDESLRKSSDWRVDMTNSIAVSINEHLALKVSLQWLYDNEPALTEVPLYAPDDPVGDPVGVVAVPVDELDTIFRASMVVNI